MNNQRKGQGLELVPEVVVAMAAEGSSLVKSVEKKSSEITTLRTMVAGNTCYFKSCASSLFKSVICISGNFYSF